MHIGYISKNKNVELAKELKEINVQIVNIKEKEDIEGKKFDILVIEDFEIEEDVINQVIKDIKYLIIQDNINNIKLQLDREINIITFGFNHKSTVTISSRTEENVIICIQRSIKNINNKDIQPQEINIKISNKYNINKYIIKKIIEEILGK